MEGRTKSNAEDTNDEFDKPLAGNCNDLIPLQEIFDDFSFNISHRLNFGQASCSQ